MRLLYRVKQLIIILGDCFCYLAALWLALVLRNWQWQNWTTVVDYLEFFAPIFFLWIVINYINGLYDLDRSTDQKAFYRQIGEAGLIALPVSMLFFYLFPSNEIAPKTILILNVLLGYSFAALWRIVADKIIYTKKLQINVILVGDNPEGRELINITERRFGKGYKVVALIDPTNTVKGTDYPDIEVYHGLHAIRPAITTKKADIVVIAPHLEKDPDAMRELYELLFWEVEIMDLPTFYELITGRVTPTVFSESWFLENLKQNKRLFYQKVKTTFDYLAATAMAMVFLISFPFISLGIKLSSPGPIFFHQKRVGKGGKVFTIYKFRSMFALSPDGSAETAGFAFAQKKDNRITWIGKFLRQTRLDEIPQFINLFKGDITLIGPRPERPEIVEKLKEQMPYYPLRHIVKPGLTGWAVIHQNYTSDLESSLQKLQYDLYYIKNRSLFLDLSIFLRTVNVVVRMLGQ